MSQRSTSEIRIRGSFEHISITVVDAAETTSGNHSSPSGTGEWELVGESGDPPRELEPSVRAVPLHLLRRSRLSTVGDWTPQRRIERAFHWGQTDAQSALDGAVQQRRDEFPLSSCVYVILYDPNGQWPRVTRSLSRFYAATKIVRSGETASRFSAFKPGIVSRGFASLVESEAYLLGASCQWPSEEF